MPSYSREINFDGIINCRDLGGYKAEDGRIVAWRRLFRSGYVHPMTARDLNRLKEELKLTSVINLRRNKAGQQKEVSLLNDAGIKYFNTPFFDYQQEELNYDFTNMGEAFLFRIRHQEYAKPIIAALEIIADPKNLPLLFHCGAGKDRSGLLAAFILSVLGVADSDIIADYILSAPYMARPGRRHDERPRHAGRREKFAGVHLGSDGGIDGSVPDGIERGIRLGTRISGDERRG